MGSTFEDFAPVIVFVSIAFVLIWLVTRAYTLSSKTKLQAEQSRGAWIAALVSSLVGLFAAAIYGIPALQDFDNPGVRFRDALLGAVTVWAICFCTWLIPARCVFGALRKGPTFQKQ